MSHGDPGNYVIPSGPDWVQLKAEYERGYRDATEAAIRVIETTCAHVEDGFPLCESCKVQIKAIREAAAKRGPK